MDKIADLKKIKQEVELNQEKLKEINQKIINSKLSFEALDMMSIKNKKKEDLNLVVDIIYNLLSFIISIDIIYILLTNSTVLFSLLNLPNFFSNIFLLGVISYNVISLSKTFISVNKYKNKIKIKRLERLKIEKKENLNKLKREILEICNEIRESKDFKEENNEYLDNLYKEYIFEIDFVKSAFKNDSNSKVKKKLK